MTWTLLDRARAADVITRVVGERAKGRTSQRANRQMGEKAIILRPVAGNLYFDSHCHSPQFGYTFVGAHCIK